MGSYTLYWSLMPTPTNDATKSEVTTDGVRGNYHCRITPFLGFPCKHFLMLHLVSSLLGWATFLPVAPGLPHGTLMVFLANADFCSTGYDAEYLLLMGGEL